MAKDFNSPQVVESYDAHIRKLIPGYELVHQQIQAVLNCYVAEDAHVLIIGCGTGYELGYLMALNPTWSFTVTELSENMLNQTRQSVEAAGQLHRVKFVLGSHTTFEQASCFDAALSILVTHFIALSEKNEFLTKAFELLKPQGIFLSFDLMQTHSNFEQRVLPEFCQMQGLSAAQATKMMQRLEDDFELISQQYYQSLLREIGFDQIHCFSQIFSYAAYCAFKTSIN
ncbi:MULTISPECIES: class I SAM-dependent methyltransferase [unclassified Acinetobacter]|uniref:class I SAM-dependent methyltransferase n=1 Tax=unclassified Acinetobacter TaxID=196816 RepID=UPI0015D2206D|nr:MULTISPECIES: class I SAM-dependent methyltransferase [unclassified Acinetobacter]UUS56445.1 class I SAM-dependent methyltransferase [Acinetobacter sp. YH16040_T]